MGAQIFRPSANSFAQISLIGLPGGAFLGALALAALSRSPANTKVNVPKDQPVPFSHQHHSWELGIDCRYCHTAVEKSANPGLPSTETCMSCHSQIWTQSPLLEPVRQSFETNTPIKWNQVNKLPEFVQFNHSIHIERGLNCNICHGAVNDMQITWKGNSFQMQWCLQCHRNPARYLALAAQNKKPGHSPRQYVFDVYWDLQTKGKAALPANEQELVNGTFDGIDDKDAVAQGNQLVKDLGIKVQQLADCSVCHY